MNQYVLGSVIKKLRESKSFTQGQFAEKLGVSDKAVSKWETGRSYPDISLLNPISELLGISVIELLAGNNIVNSNRSGNMKNIKLYVCPICGNVITSVGDALVSCCGITLPCLDVDDADDGHTMTVEVVEDEYFVNIEHPMTKEHFISFVCAVSDDSADIVKLYPELNAQARFKIARTKYIYYYCNKHGLFRYLIRHRSR